MQWNTPFKQRLRRNPHILLETLTIGIKKVKEKRLSKSVLLSFRKTWRFTLRKRENHFLRLKSVVTGPDPGPSEVKRTLSFTLKCVRSSQLVHVSVLNTCSHAEFYLIYNTVALHRQSTTVFAPAPHFLNVSGPE